MMPKATILLAKCQIQGSTILFIGSKEAGLTSFQFWMRGFCGIHLMMTTLYSQNIFCEAADVSDVDCILNCDSESVSISANNLEAYLHLPIVTRNATGLVAPAIAAGLGALTHTLGTLVPVK
ncbi:unnamed protein product [Camellia sinensis]